MQKKENHVKYKRKELEKVVSVIKIVMEMYITMLPVILAGVLNMIWCKTNFASNLKIPMDNNMENIPIY